MHWIALIVNMSRKTFRRLLLQHTYRMEGGKKGREMEWPERGSGESVKERRREGERGRYGEEEKDGRWERRKDVQQMCILKFSFQNSSIDRIRTIKQFFVWSDALIEIKCILKQLI